MSRDEIKHSDWTSVRARSYIVLPKQVYDIGSRRINFLTKNNHLLILTYKTIPKLHTLQIVNVLGNIRAMEYFSSRIWTTVPTP